MRQVTAALAALLALAACEYRPGGTAYVFQVDSKEEYTTWRLERPALAGPERPAIRLKWYDENTYLTYEKLEPGPYALSLRRKGGRFYRIDFEVKPGQWLYKFPDPSAGGRDAGPAADAAAVRGKLDLPAADMPPLVVLVFSGKDVVLRRAGLKDGEFRVEPPPAGRYIVEVIVPGDPPRSWRSQLMDIRGPADLGTIRPGG
jgi:hypothetical protein